VSPRRSEFALKKRRQEFPQGRAALGGELAELPVHFFSEGDGRQLQRGLPFA
jgi:hypothetical protein